MSEKRPLLDADPHELRDWLFARGHPAYRAETSDPLGRRGANRVVRGDDRSAEAAPRRAGRRVDRLRHRDRPPRRRPRRHRQAPPRLPGWTSGRVRPDGRGRPADRLHQHPGRLRDGVRLLRQRDEGGRAEPHERRASRAGTPAPQPPARRGSGEGEPRGDGDGGEPRQPRQPAVPALDWICSPDGLGMGQRRITISTVGLPEEMQMAAGLDRQYHLAVSLHAPTEGLRDRLVPINEKVGLSAVMEAADACAAPSRADRLPSSTSCWPAWGTAGRTRAAAWPNCSGRGRPTQDLMPYNPVEGLPFRGRPSPRGGPAVRRHGPARGGVSVSVRKTKGRPRSTRRAASSGDGSRGATGGPVVAPPTRLNPPARWRRPVAPVNGKGRPRLDGSERVARGPARRPTTPTSS